MLLKFRSEEMEYVSLTVQEDSANECIARLGRMGAFQFADLNPELTPFQRRFVTELKRCDEMERKLRLFRSALNTMGVSTTCLEPMDVVRFLEQTEIKAHQRPSALVLKELDELLSEKEQELNDLNGYHANLTREYNERVELKHVLSKARLFFSPEYQTEAREVYADPEVAMPLVERICKFNFVTGVVSAENKSNFERQIFRSTRGNCLMRFEDIEEEILDPQTGLAVNKVVFIIFFQAPSIEPKLRRSCDAFGAHRYDIPDLDNVEEVDELMLNTRSDIDDRARVLKRNRDNLMQLLREDIAVQLEQWHCVIKREKAVFHTLNMFKTDVPGFLRGEAWVVSESAVAAAAILRDTAKGTNESPNFMNRLAENQWPTPPTYFKTNKVTSVFQNVVDTYGVPRYREANPAPFTMITFPFLFGVMYGDIGHGSFLWLAATLMIVFEKRILRSKPNEIFMMAFEGRYMLWPMGLFAVYMGFVYNDVFSLGISLSPSTWQFTSNTVEASRIGNGTFPVYTFGLDPIWHVAENELIFVNSLKMKMSVILGVAQMTMGLFLRLMNAIHFRSTVDILFEALPQLVFMISLFGYMNFLIVFKWCQDWATLTAEGQEPPSLINTLINIVLKPGSEPDNAMFASQKNVQTLVLVLVMLMVPMMLFPKPYLLNKANHKKANDERGEHQRLASIGEEETKVDTDDHEEHSFGELFIHQAIETIEFVLGSVSNTASYLRLWALSLAHSELATVFWDKAMASTIATGNPVLVFIGFGVFSATTFGVLLMMDVLECFLHALRLHWVEFQNKFFKADGYKFAPLDFYALLNVDEAL